MGETIGYTRSICPICGQQLPAARVRENGAVYLRKVCPQHGPFSVLIWRESEGAPAFESWRGDLPELKAGENRNCPQDCGLCPEHAQDTCCILYEITSRCDLACRFCFAASGGGQDIPLSQVKEDISRLVRPGATLLQLSGGEPALRGDLPEIVAYAKQAGCRYVQLNSNGLRLGREPDFAAELAAAGLSFVFMQFDGIDDSINLKLRGRPLLREKRQAIENCAQNRIGVTLVPTLVPGVNTDDIGNIIRLAVSLSPAVRGVHFQPAAYMGRYPQPPGDDQRYTLADLLAAIPAQTAGLISAANIAPSHCDHPLCGFHAAFISEPDGGLTPITQPQACCCSRQTTAEQNREYIGRRWQRGAGPTEPATDGFERFLQKSRERAFTVTAMAFQDAWNLDIERLRRCSLHVYNDGRVVPFCANYLSLSGEADEN